MDTILQNLILHSSELLIGITGIAGTVVGANIAAKASFHQDRVKALRDAYADVFAGYYSCLQDTSDKNLLALVIAMERAILICSPESEAIMREALPIVARDPVDVTALGNIILGLRESSKKDMKHNQRKQ